MPASYGGRFSLSGCSLLFGGTPINREARVSGGILRGMRRTADPALVERIREDERKEAEKQAAQGTIVGQTGGAQIIQPGLGRNLPKVSTDPISTPTNITAQSTTIQDQNNAFANQNAQLATYESAYSAVPPPPGSLAAGLVPPPPAVTLSTQAQTYGGNMAETAANFYNNPYFNPYGIPAPPQAATIGRPAGLFGDSNARNQPESSSDRTSSKHKADFVPITPTGMESRSPYKQRDDLRALWKGTVKESENLGALSDNKRLMDELASLEIGLPAESSRGNFNITPRQIETVFKSSSIDRRIFTEVRQSQTEVVQAYYRYLSTYNKYALAEQTVAARQQQVDLSDSDSERQRAAADLAQAKNDLDSIKDDMRSAEVELAAASSPAAARTVISRIAGVAPSVESLAQACSHSNNHIVANHNNRFTNIFESVFKHNHSVAPREASDNDDSAANNSKDNDKASTKKLVGARFTEPAVTSKTGKNKTRKIAANKSDDTNDDLAPAPVEKVAKKEAHLASDDIASEAQEPVHKSSSSNSTVSFQLNGVDIKPRKSVLKVSVKNRGEDTFELNPDAIFISEGNRKLAAADIRADFDMTSIQPDHEVKGTITVFGQPWNDRLLVYLNDGNKTIQLRR